MVRRTAGNERVRQDEVTIGVPAYREASELTVANLLSMPFRRQRDYWRLPDDGHPDRAEQGDRSALQP